MKAVYRKEMRQYFHSVIGYVFLAIFVFINAFYFLLQNLLTRSGDITDYFRATITLEMFLMPMLTMRSFSEEKKQKTDLLLYTVPVDCSQVVLAKFLAAETMFLLGLAVTVAFPVILAMCGSVQIWITIGNYIGIILLMSSFIAIGIFVSTLTENQIVSAIISYVLIFALWYSYGLGSAIQNPMLLQLLNKLSLMQMYYELALGILNPTGIALNLAITASFLLLTTAVVRGKRGWHRGASKKSQQGDDPCGSAAPTAKAESLRIACLILSIAVIFGIYSVISAATDRFSWKIDMTEGQVFRLTDTTKGVLDGLEQTVTFTYCNDRADADTNLKEVLSRYKAASSKVQVDYMDLDANPALADEYSRKGIELSPDGILVTCGVQARFIQWSDLYEIRTTSSGDGSQGYSITGLKAETLCYCGGQRTGLPQRGIYSRPL